MEKSGQDWFRPSPIQQMYFDHATNDAALFTQDTFLRITRHVSPSQIESAMLQLIQRHASLRARFKRSADGSWSQRLGDDIPGSMQLRQHKLNGFEHQKILKTIEEGQNALDIRNGPLLAVDVMETETLEQFLSISVHHLVIDLVSWRILLQELEDALTIGVELGPLPPVTFRQWCIEQERFAINHLGPEDALPVEVPPIPSNYWGHRTLECNNFIDAQYHSFAVDKETTTAILGPAMDVLQAGPVEILHAALLHSFAQVFDDRPPPTIFGEGHGREPWDDSLDLSQTIGWFTTIYPVVVRASPNADLWEILSATKEARQSVPRNGWAYFASRFLNPKGREMFKNHTPIEIMLNFTGKFQQLERSGALFIPTAVPREGASYATANLRRFGLMDFNVTPLHGELKFEVHINRHMQHQPRILDWFAKFRQLLATIPQHCQQQTARSCTVADFPLLSTSEADLHALISRVTSGFQVSLSAIEDIYPCSPMQRQILLSQTKSEALYETKINWTVKSATQSFVNIDKVQSSWERVVAHHPILRTVFVENVSQDGSWGQVVLKSLPAEVCYVKDNAKLGTNPSGAPSKPDSIFRHRLIISQCEPSEVSCCLEINHALFDGATGSLIIRDFQLAYDDYLPSVTGPLYGNYISYLQSLPRAAAASYWIQRFDNFPPSILPGMAAPLQMTAGHHPRPKSLLAQLPNWTNLSLFCKAHGLTPATLLQVAWGLVLRSYTGDSTVCFGYPTSGRDIPVAGVRDLVGPLVNLLPCILQISSQPVLAVLREHQDIFIRGLQHQHFSLSDLLHALRRPGEPLFNTAISVENDPSGDHDSSSSSISLEVEGLEDATEFDAVLHVALSKSTADISLVYWDNVIPKLQAQSIVDTFLHTISQIVENPGLPMSELALLSPHSHQKIIEWNATMPDVTESCIHELIVQNAALLPQYPAVCGWDGVFTFAELDHLSSRLASYLCEQGVRPEKFVPVYMSRSRWTPVALLAVLKARGAFVLLDATQPPSRVQSLCQDVPCGPVVTNVDISSFHGEIFPHVVRVDLEDAPWLQHGYTIALSPGNPGDAAYAVFTSGSTGKPKMVVIENRSFCSAGKAQMGRLNLSRHSRVLQFASYAFDAAVLEHLTTLMAGGCICIPDENDRQQNLTNAMIRLEVNWALLTPSLARTLNPSEIPSLDTLVLGSEACRPSDLVQWARVPHLINAYGPSECSVITTMQPELRQGELAANIGHAAGAVCWIVHPDNHHRLTNIGAIGELLVEGPIVGRGYFGLVEKTAQTFIAPPAWLRRFRGHARSRLYKTGDLVQYTPAGSLRYLGRKDTQVKIRGQRLELGEVEHHLAAAMPMAQEVVAEMAMMPDRDTTKPYLVAFVAHADCENNSSLLEAWSSAKSYLEATVPRYMVPSGLFFLPAIPRTATDKVDRKTLRQKAIHLLQEQWKSPITSMRSQNADLSDVERELRSIWAEVLRRDPETIAVDDNFSYIGGDSIEALKVAGIAQKRGLQVKVHNLLTSPSLRDLASNHTTVNSLEEESKPALTLAPFSLLSGGHEAALSACHQAAKQCSLPQDRIEDIYPCTPLQEGMMALTAQTHTAYIIHRRFALPVTVNLDRAREAWELTARAHPILRTRIVQLDNDQIVQAVVADDLHWQGQENGEDMPAMEYGSPLWYFRISRQEDRWQLTISLHHAVGDAWSLPLLLKAAHTAYEQLHTTPVLSPPPFQNFIQSLSTSASAAFWKEQFEGQDPISFPALPSASYRPTASARSSASLQIQHRVGQRTLLTNSIRLSWAITQSLYQGSTSSVFGIMSSGRTASVPGIDNMTGPTIATIPLLISLDPKMTAERAIEQLRMQIVRTIPFEQAGLQNIARLGPGPASACAFQTLLSVLHRSTTEEEKDHQIWQPQSESPGMMTYALTIECVLGNGVIDVCACFDDQVIPEPHMRRLLRQFVFTLQQVEQGIDRRLDQIMKICPEELHEQCTFSPTPDVQPIPSVLELLRFQCQRHPQNVAVESWDGTFTYSEMDLLSDRLAGYISFLRSDNLEFYVPLLFEKSRWTVVALLAVVKAGGSFVLMDPAHPLTRLKEIAQQVQADVVLTSPTQAARAQGLSERVIFVSDAHNDWGNNKELPTVNSDRPLYSVFTSGSTGRPKGVVVEHRSFVFMAQAFNGIVGLAAGAKMLQFASYAFDASILEILAPLIAGAAVAIVSDTDRQESFQRAIDLLHPTHALLTPSFVRALPGDRLSTVETLILGGEAVRAEDVTRWHKGMRVMNAYGPAECSVVSTIQPDATKSLHPSNIGKPISSACWVVDPHDSESPVPVGAVGELLIEGPNVARGYINSVEKTVASFVQLPTWLRALRPDVASTDRVYLTGDLVRYESDGSLTFCGRKDAEFKIRGQRVHMGEVENRVQECFSQAQDVIVEVASLRGMRQTMVAFLQLNTTPEQTTGEGLLLPPSTARGTSWSQSLTQLGEILPEYMLPSLFLPVRVIPQTTTGKVDRSRLRQIVESLSMEEMQTYAGLTESKRQVSSMAERSLQAVWARVLVLDKDQIGADDSFFRLGGDSITAMQASTQARSLGVFHSVADLLRWKTVAQVAAHARHEAVQKAPESSVNSSGSFCVTPYQQSILELENQPYSSIRLRLTQKLSVDKIRNAIITVVRRHPMLRAKFHQDAQGIWKQSIASPVESSLFVHQPEVQAEWDTLPEVTHRALNINDGPVFSVDLLDSLEGDQHLNLVAHPLIIDNKSLQIICRDLERLLYDDGDGMCPNAPVLGFREWCTQQRQPPKNESHTMAMKVDKSHDIRIPDIESLVSSGFTLDQQATQFLYSAATSTCLSLHTLLTAFLLSSFTKEFPAIPSPIIFTEQEVTRSQSQFEVVGPFVSRHTVPVPPAGCDDLLRTLRHCKDTFTHGRVESSFENATKVYFKYTRELSTNNRLCLVEQGLPLNLPPNCSGVTDIQIHMTESQDQLHFQFSGHRAEQFKQWVELLENYLVHFLPTSPVLRRQVFVLDDFPLLSLNYPDLDLLLYQGIPSAHLALDHVETIYPCSPLQQGLILIQERDAVQFHVSLSWNVRSTGTNLPADASRFEDAWKKVVARHESLRSVFVKATSGEDHLYQVLLKPGPIPIKRVSCEETAPEIATHAVSTQHPQKPSNGQLLHNLTIGKTSQNGLFVRLDVNHVVMDGVSLGIIERDLCLAYDGLLDIQQPTRYRDYVAHLRQQQAAESAEAERHWREYLHGLTIASLPAPVSGLPDSSSKSSFKSIRVPLANSTQLGRVCADLDITISTLFHLAWALVLWRFTGHPDVCFGSFISGRDIEMSKIQDTVGLFINVLVCRVTVDKDNTFRHLLHLVQDEYARNLSHRSLPLAEIAHLAALPANDLIRSVVNVRASSAAELVAPNSTLELERIDGSEFMDQDISLLVDTSSTGLEVSLDYRPSGVSSSLVAQMADYLNLAVSSILAQPDDMAWGLNGSLSANDQKRLTEWSSLTAEGISTCLHPLVDRWARDQPHALAATAIDGTLTYAELQFLSDRLARHITTMAIRPRTFIPLFFEKSRWAIVAVLAVIKAGCAFLLLDPSHPVERLEFICSEANAALVLSSEKLAPTASMLAPRTLVVSDENLNSMTDIVDHHPPQISPEDPLYMMFTSGSTGRPKGAVNHHGAFVSSNTALIRPFGLDSKSTVLHFSSYSFDVSVQEILLTLMVGGTIAILSDAQREVFLLQGCSPMPVTHAILTPSVANLLDPRQASTWVNTIVLIGEAVPRSYVKQWAGVARIINSYGPAECAVTSHCTEALEESSDAVNIGHARGAFGWVVDPTDHTILAPIGAVGELVLHGPAVGRGYHNEPEKTAAAFVPPPSSWSVDRPDLGSRCYRTGDLVRYELDGTLRFEGRSGTQAKLRGQRVELGEIEYQAQRSFPGAKAVVAEVVTLAGGVAHIVAFVAMDEGSEQSPQHDQPLLLPPESGFLRLTSSAISRLEQILPSFMIPSYFLPMRSFPQTMSDKTDRRRLREIVLTLPEKSLSAYIGLLVHREPSNAREETLRQIWAQALGLDSSTVGVDDDFFQLGGDSVMAMKIASVARAAGFNIRGPDILIQRMISRLAL